MPPRRRSGLTSVPLTDGGGGVDLVIPAGPTAPNPALSSTPAGSQREKISGYVAADVADQARNAIAALGADIDDPQSLSELIEGALRREIDRLVQQRHDGAPFPPRPRRNLRSGPRPG